MTTPPTSSPQHRQPMRGRIHQNDSPRDIEMDEIIQGVLISKNKGRWRRLDFIEAWYAEAIVTIVSRFSITTC